MPKNNPTDHTKKLSVLIRQDGLSFYTYDATGILEQAHREFRHTANPTEILQSIEDCYEQEAFLDSAFAKATLFYHHNIFTSVPSEIYREEQAVDYLKYNSRILETDVISTDLEVGNLHLNTVYIAYGNINNFFFDRYGSFEFYHYSSRLLELRSQEPVNMNFMVTLEIKEKDFYLTILKDGKLLNHNLFPYDAIEDILYYTMFTTHQSAADPETMKLLIKSKKKDKKLYELLYTYVRHVSFDEQYDHYIEQLICV